MGQAGSSQQLGEVPFSADEYGPTSQRYLWEDENLARYLQEAEFTGNSIDIEAAAIDDQELQMARDAELAHYMNANDGVLPPGFIAIGSRGQYHWSGKAETIKYMNTCVACDDQKPQHEVLQAPCRHYYCGECLEYLFRQSLTDETYFPPRCDTQEILLFQAKGLISHDLASEFEAKYIELSTSDRTYCHDVICSSFIPPQAIDGNIGRCGGCDKTTCTLCKGNSHRRGDCPQDAALQQETARQHGWRRCERCNRMIELTQGCNHMSCVCGNQFCYVCGRAPWKSCGCDAFDQNRLLYHAQDIVNRGQDIQNEAEQLQENGHPAQPVVLHQVYQARMDLVRQQVANNHEDCDHPMPWSRYQEGEHECTVCHTMNGNKSVGWCRQCYFVSCYPCRRKARNRRR